MKLIKHQFGNCQTQHRAEGHCAYGGIGCDVDHFAIAQTEFEAAEERAERAEAEADRSIGVLTTALQVAGERADRYEAALRNIGDACDVPFHPLIGSDEAKVVGMLHEIAAIARAALSDQQGQDE